ncbi:hypothetical protein [Croceibacterium ferulae]|uniref:hypothetical protein n=1 Tax=Croceibacterium ferulae TaxID=1854641 RepID=UPI000F873EAE|nr:hypothetical protein [Croceibacterium ferulae]
MNDTATKPFASGPEGHPSRVLLLRNEGSRSLQIIGDLAAGDAKVMPGCAFEIDLATFGGAVRVTVCDGGIQVDCAGEAAGTPGVPFWTEPHLEQPGVTGPAGR